MTTAHALFSSVDNALRTLFAKPHAIRPCPKPAATQPFNDLSMKDQALSGALMRVNHVGEICAQALYAAQALSTKDPVLREQFTAAGIEEGDHLAWTRERLDELGARQSFLNPLWYAGAFGLGLLAGRLGDKVSLGFLVETERLVEAHLADHMDRLPHGDHKSKAIVIEMKGDEARHARQAAASGAMDLPFPVKALMVAAAKVMTTVAHRV